METEIKLEENKLLGYGGSGAKMVGFIKPGDKIVLDHTRMLGNNSSGVSMNSAKPASPKPTVRELSVRDFHQHQGSGGGLVISALSMGKPMQSNASLDLSRRPDAEDNNTEPSRAERTCGTITLDHAHLLGNDKNGVFLLGVTKPELVKPNE